MNCSRRDRLRPTTPRRSEPPPAVINLADSRTCAPHLSRPRCFVPWLVQRITCGRDALASPRVQKQALPRHGLNPSQRARQVESFLTYKIGSPRHRVESELTYRWRQPSPTKPPRRLRSVRRATSTHRFHRSTGPHLRTLRRSRSHLRVAVLRHERKNLPRAVVHPLLHHETTGRSSRRTRSSGPRTAAELPLGSRHRRTPPQSGALADPRRSARPPVPASHFR